MANTESDKKKLNELKGLEKVVAGLMQHIDPDFAERAILDHQNNRFQSIIDKELNVAKGVSRGSITDFLTYLNSQSEKKSGFRSADYGFKTTNSLLEENIGDIFSYYQDLYKNKYIEIQDLKFISRFIPALGEAVKTTLDHIVASDDISQIITRRLEISDSSEINVSAEIVRMFEKVEKDEKLLTKLKNVIYKNTLVSGEFYVYAVAYRKIFENYSKVVAERQQGDYNNRPGIKVKRSDNRKKDVNKSAFESSIDIDFDPVKEIVTEAFNEEKTLKSIERENVTKELNKIIDSISFSVLETSIPMDALEDLFAFEATTNDKEYRLKSYDNTFNNLLDTSSVIDGVYNKNNRTVKKRAEKFDTINGTYIKMIHAKHIIPIKALNQTIGYFYIYESNKKQSFNNKGASSGGYGMTGSITSVFNSINMSERRKDEVIQKVVDNISTQIIDQFSKKFVEVNHNYKRLIADCILSQMMTNTDFKIQYIPAEDMIPFIINEDEDGRGHSILEDSLFPAKLLLSLLICKLLNYFNNSGNRTISYVSKGPIDVSNTNQYERVLRNMQETNITFTDLLSTNMVFSKFTRDKNLMMPKARNGERLVEFETMEGQNIDLNTDMEDKLEKMAIMGTGVPSVLMEHITQMDFAKSITTLQIKFSGRVASLQSDLEGPTTELYRIIGENSNLDEKHKLVIEDSFEFKLPRPKSLSAENASQSINNLKDFANTISAIVYGEDTTSPTVQLKKNELIKFIVMDYSPHLNWSDFENLKRRAELSANKLLNSNNPDQTGESGGF